MGNKTTKMANSSNSAADVSTADNNDGNTYALLKRRPGCTGMFWRQDPSPGAPRLAGNADWPRDGAHLKGRVFTDAKGQAWLVASHVQQKKGTWKVAPRGSAMPFEYDNHYYLEQVKQVEG